MEGQKFTVCVHWRQRQQQSLLAGQGGRGEEVVYEERRERARDARGKEGLWAGGGARWRSMAGDRRRQMSGGGETEVGRNSSPKKNGAGGVESSTEESAPGVVNPLHNFISQR